MDTTTVRKFDLVVDGNCKFGGDNIGLDVTPNEKRPELFTAENGVIKFEDPQRFGTFVMPRGHDATVTILLKEIRDKESEKTTPATDVKLAKDYLCLGIRQKDKPTQIIYKIDETDEINSIASIDLKGGEEFELAPLVSTSKLFTACDAVKQKSDIPDGFITGNAIDFSAVYRIDVGMEERIEIDQSIPKTATWEVKDCVFNDVADYMWTVGHVAIGPINGEIQLLASYGENVSGGSKMLAVSEDGITWNKLCDTTKWYKMLEYGNGQWWGVETGKYELILSTNAISWEPTGQIISGIQSIAFGDKRFMAVTHDKKVYTLLKGETEWHQPIEEQLQTITDGFYWMIIYGNGRWICAGNGGAPTLAYDVGDEKSGWKRLEDSGIPVSSDNPQGGWYAHGYFYAAWAGDQIYKLKFPGGTKWELDWNGSGAGENITYFEKTDKLYSYSRTSNTVLVGSFND